MRDLSGRTLHTRVKGRGALLRRLRGLLLAVHRYHRTRATTDADRRWCAVLIDQLEDAVAAADPGSVPTRRVTP